MRQVDIETQVAEYESQASAFAYRAKRAKNKQDAREWSAEAKRLTGLANRTARETPDV